MRALLRRITSLGLLGAVAAIVLGAAQQPRAQDLSVTTPAAPTSTGIVAAPSASPSASTPHEVPPASRPPPAAPEETATIHDDPTVAPDSQESADNAVTFPTDI